MCRIQFTSPVISRTYGYRKTPEMAGYERPSPKTRGLRWIRKRATTANFKISHEGSRFSRYVIRNCTNWWETQTKELLSSLVGMINAESLSLEAAILPLRLVTDLGFWPPSRQRNFFFLVHYFKLKMKILFITFSALAPKMIWVSQVYSGWLG